MSEQRIAALIRKMNAAPDFGYDDEGVELTALLKDWKWSDDMFRPKVETFNL